MRIGIIGGGTWGLTLANVLSDNKNEVLVYMRNEEKKDSFNKTHKIEKLDADFNKEISASSDIRDFSEFSYLVYAVPTQNIRRSLEDNIKYFKEDVNIISVSKGIEIGTGKRISEIFQDFIDLERFAILTGPTHAEEVSVRMPSAIVSSSINQSLMEKAQDLFMNEYFRAYTNSDIISCELGAATKNILALAIGFCDGLGYGDNTKAAVMTRGMHEIVRLGEFLGGRKETFYGLTGMGDLIVTAGSKHSRNRRAGVLLGQGAEREEIEEKVGMVVEGIATTKACYELAEKNGLDLPITKELYQILFEGKKAEKALQNLMSRERKEELI